MLGVKIANALPPLFVCANAATIWSVYVFFHLMPMLQLGVVSDRVDSELRWWGVLEAVISQVLTLLLLINFTCAVSISPGSIPDTPQWRMGGGIDSSHVPTTHETTRSGERRRCRWCQKYKPDRTHHCRICKTCVLKMDHHCPWIMNCVGWNNHKYFFLLVTYGLITCAFIIPTVFQSVEASAYKDMPSLDRFLLVLCLVLAGIFFCLLAVFLAFHTYLMLNAMTTIEYCEKNTVEKTGGKYQGSHYNRGWYDNIKAVLGPYPLLWFLPVCPPKGDGVLHRLNSLVLTPDAVN